MQRVNVKQYFRVLTEFYLTFGVTNVNNMLKCRNLKLDTKLTNGLSKERSQFNYNVKNRLVGNYNIIFKRVHKA